MEDRLLYRIQEGLVANGRLVTLLLCLVVGTLGGLLIAFVSPLIALALVVALAGGLVMLRSTQWGLFALIGVICLLPFGAVPIYLGFYPTFLDVVLLTLFAVWLVRALSRPDEKLISSPLDLPILIFVVLAFFSFVMGLRYGGLTKDTLRHFAEVIIAIALYFVTVNVVRKRTQLEQVVRVIMLAGFAAAFIGVLLYFLPETTTIRLLSSLRIFHYPAGFGVLRFIEDNPELPMRATSTSIDPNVLGGLLITITALTAPHLFARRPLFPRVWVALALMSMVTCMVLTFSRGSFMGLGVALAFLGVVRYRRLFFLLLVAGIAILVLPQTQVYVQHFLEGLTGQDRATQMRMGEYYDALNLIARYPWFGVGFAGVPSIDLYVGVSSVYLLMAEEMGLVGLGAFFLIVGLFFTQTWRAWRRLTPDSWLDPILLGLMAALVGTLVGGIFDHYFFNLDFPHSVAFFWLTVALTMVAARLAAQEEGISSVSKLKALLSAG
ncbi:MAG: O-antigen ligase family protein [Anaerolineae bacterium]